MRVSAEASPSDASRLRAATRRHCQLGCKQRTSSRSRANTLARSAGTRHRVPVDERPCSEQAVVNRPQQMPADSEEILHHVVDGREALLMGSPEAAAHMVSLQGARWNVRAACTSRSVSRAARSRRCEWGARRCGWPSAHVSLGCRRRGTPAGKARRGSSQAGCDRGSNAVQADASPGKPSSASPWCSGLTRIASGRREAPTRRYSETSPRPAALAGYRPSAA